MVAQARHRLPRHRGQQFNLHTLPLQFQRQGGAVRRTSTDDDARPSKMQTWQKITDSQKPTLPGPMGSGCNGIDLPCSTQSQTIRNLRAT